jgi:hypothetical protein
MKTITVSARKYTYHDDCLQAAADDYVATHPEAAGWDLSARWADDANREEIALDVPGAERTDEQWWAWHDADASRWTAGEDVEAAAAAAESRCAARVAGESADGP